jgi:hypothetical protein
VLSGLVGGAAVGAGSDWFYNTIRGKETAAQDVEGAALLGAVFGAAGGLGEYGFSAESGGAGFGPAFDINGGNVFDLALGIMATASTNTVGL